jgi:hypothetical protein
MNNPQHLYANTNKNKRHFDSNKFSELSFGSAIFGSSKLSFSGISGLSGLRFSVPVPRGFQTCFPFQPLTFKILIYFTLRAHIAQWSPTTTVARGTFMRVHVAFNDVIRSHHSHFSSRPTGTWYISMCPCPFLVKSNRSDLSQIYNANPFGVSGFRASEVRASTHLELPFAEILKSLSIKLLDPTVKFFSPRSTV